MTSSQEAEPTIEPMADPRLVSSIIKEKPPVALLREDIKVNDRFGSQAVADGLADVIQKVEPPFTISISGTWGVGKTTLAKQLRDRLTTHKPDEERVRCVEIDLWAEDIANLRRLVALKVAVGLQDHQEKDVDDALKAKAAEFDEELRTTQTRQERPKVSIPTSKRGRIRALLLVAGLAALVWFLWGYTTPTDPTVEATGAKFLLTAAAAILIWVLIQSGLVLSVVTSSSSTQPAAEAIGLQLKFKDEVTKHQDRTVLVILDNLDRLSGEAAVATLAEVRSFMDFEKSRCVFLVPLDREALERHLRRTMGGDDRSARDYLDKFFNLDVLLTKPVTSDLRVWTRELLAALFPGVEARVLSPVAEYAAAAADGSPRATKRILNGVYTRAYLLPRTSAVSIDELVVVEALIARFPMCVKRLSAEPRVWLDTVEAVRSTSDGDAQREKLRWLLDRSAPAAASATTDGVEVEDEEVDPFRNFLMVTRNVELRPESVRAILSLRLDRLWGPVYRGDEAALALQNGDASGLTSILEETPIEDRSQTIRAALDQLKADLNERLTVAVLNSINALSLVMPGYDEFAKAFRDDAADFLLTASSRDFRSLSFEAIEFIFGPGLRTLPRSAAIVDRAITGLAAGPTPNATAVVQILATISPEIEEKTAERARPLLAGLSDSEVAPLFGDVGRNRGLIVPGVEGTYRARLIAWDANDADQSQFETAAQRLRLIRGTDWSADDTADQVASRATAQIPSLPDSALGSVAAIAAMLQDVGPNTNIDAFALALAGSPSLELFKIGLRLASAPLSLGTVAAARLDAAGLDEFRGLAATERIGLEAAGVDVATIAAARWAAGKGFEYARMTIAPHRDADVDALVIASTGIADTGVYVDIISAVLPVLAEFKAERAAAGIVADIAERVPSFKGATLEQVAPVVRSLQELAEVDAVIAALLASVSSAPASEIEETTSVVRSYVDAKVKGADALPPALAEHAAALGTIDMDRVLWLVRQKGVRADHVRTALVALIRTESPETVLPALGTVRSALRKAWPIGKALVERAAASPDGLRDAWLVEAEGWGVPPSTGQRQARDDYSSALDVAAADPAAQATVASLRAKL